MHPEKNHVRRFVADAADFLGMAERALRTARKSGARGDAHLLRVENGAKELRRLTRAIERGQL